MYHPRLNDMVRIRPYTTVYGYFTDRITAVISGTEIRSIYGRKLPVFSSFTVRKRPVNDTVLTDLGH